MNRVGSRISRSYGAIKLVCVIKQGERRPYPDVEAYFGGKLILSANQTTWCASGDMHKVDDSLMRIAGGLAVRLAREQL